MLIIRIIVVIYIQFTSTFKQKERNVFFIVNKSYHYWTENMRESFLSFAKIIFFHWSYIKNYQILHHYFILKQHRTIYYTLKLALENIETNNANPIKTLYLNFLKILIFNNCGVTRLPEQFHQNTFGRTFLKFNFP